MSEGIEDRIVRVIATQLDMDTEEVEFGSFLMDDLGADPYDLEELANVLSEEFDVDISEEDVEAWETVSDVIHFISEKLDEMDEDED